MNTQTSQPSQTEESGGMKETVREAGKKIKGKASEVVAQTREQGSRYFDQGKARTADRIGRIGESLRQTADRFEQEEDPNIAHYTRLVAGKIEDAAAYVRERDLAQLRRDAEDLARRHPVLFYGGMFTLGLAAARFIKASAERETSMEEQSAAEESPAMTAGIM